MLQGREALAAAEIGALTEETPYDPQEDIAFYRGDSSRLLLSGGMFAVFFPQDGHMGGIAVGEPREEVRIVIKVRISPA